uniref:5-hydroxytryptamine receptor 3B n=1 Tax=Cacopsylla melanoneura TaxID=428564 RepID=A0A8D8TL53_9HEMI
MDWILYCVILSVGVSFLLVPSQGQEDTCPTRVKNSTLHNLQSCLLKDYDSKLRPVNATDIYLEFDLEYLSLDGDKISMAGPIYMSWDDERLAYDSDFYNVDGVELNLPLTSIWTPPLMSKVSAGRGYTSSSPVLGSSEGYYLYSDALGRVNLFEMISLYGLCHNPDYSFYPFDVHNCTAYINIPDPGIMFTHSLGGVDNGARYHEYYDIVQEFNVTSIQDSTGTLMQYNIVFRRHTTMFIILLHVPILAFLLFNFISLWLSPNHLLRLGLPVASFCGSLYQLNNITILIKEQNTDQDAFSVVGEKPLHIVLLYRNIIVLSLLVLLENSIYSLLGLERKMLISVLEDYSPTFASARKAALNKTTKPESQEEDEEREEEEEEDEDNCSPVITTPPEFDPIELPSCIKSILVGPGPRPDLLMDASNNDKPPKGVSFKDGILPGEGTSQSESEDNKPTSPGLGVGLKTSSPSSTASGAGGGGKKKKKRKKCLRKVMMILQLRIVLNKHTVRYTVTRRLKMFKIKSHLSLKDILVVQTSPTFFTSAQNIVSFVGKKESEFPAKTI